MLGRMVAELWRSLFHRFTPAGRLQAARAALAGGDPGRAIRYAERALDQDPELRDARVLLAEVYLHGRSYEEVIAEIHQHLRPRTYVEIGVDTGASLRRALPETRAIGVDPAPAVQYDLPPKARIFAETSDHFFANRDVRAELGGLAVELAFIDGMHHFEFALRDFINLERLCSRGATILVHDCFPLDRVSAQRERQSGFWSGDVWRLIVLLKKYRPDLKIHNVAAPPTGLAVIRGLDPSSSFLADNLARLTEEFLRLDYRYLRDGRAEKLNLVPNDWAAIRALLDQPAQVP